MIYKIIEFLSIYLQENWNWLLLITTFLLIILIHFRMIIGKSIRKYKWEILVFSTSILFFGSIIINQSWVDIQLHCYNLSESLNKGSFPGYPLYFFLIYALSGFQNNSTLFIISSGIVLSSIFVIKYYAIKQYFQIKKVFSSELMIFFLCFIGVIFYSAEEQYIGKHSLTCFHNSTSMPLLPISILMLMYSIKYLKNGSDLNLRLKLIALSSISMLFKPSFMFIFLPVFILFLLIMKKNKIIEALIIFLPSIIILALEYLFIFASEQVPTNSIDSDIDNGIAFGWLDVWHQKSPSYLQKAIDILMPIIFPLIYLYYRPQARKHLEFKFLLVLLISSFFFANMIYEDGSRMLHGNFKWHIHIINILFFLYCVRDWLENKLNFSNFTNKLFRVIIFIHVIFGFLAMYNFIFHGMHYNEWFDPRRIINLL